MNRVMYDAIDWRAIPETADLVAGYASGKYTWPDEAWAMFPGKPVVRIAVQPWHDVGNVLVVRENHGSPRDVPDWLIKARVRGENPSVYCALSARRSVIDACHFREVDPPYFWVTNLDNVALLPSGAIAKQYRARGAYDMSVVADHWPGVDTPR